MAASGDPEGGVLDGLELLDGGLWGIGEPDWGSVCEKRPDEGLEGQHQCLLLLAPVCTGEGLDYFGFFFGSGGYSLDVVMEIEMGVERDPQDFRGALFFFIALLLSSSGGKGEAQEGASPGQSSRNKASLGGIGALSRVAATDQLG